MGAPLSAAPTVQARPFKWTSASDIPTLDVHSQNNALGNGVHAAAYDSLGYYDSTTFKPEAQLPTSWKEISPTQVRFNVAPFDALYSLQSLTRSVGTRGDGNYNVGRYKNQRIVVDRVKVVADLPVRNRILPGGLRISNDTVSHIPLHKQIIPRGHEEVGRGGAPRRQPHRRRLVKVN